MKKATTALASALLIGLTSAPAAAASANFHDARVIKGEKALAAELTLGTGEVAIAPGAFDKLYDVRVDYSPEHLEPKVRYGEGVVSMYALAQRKLGVPGQNAWQVSFTQKLPLKLHADLGAAKSDLDLTGLRLTDCTLLMGASLATVRFSTPNPTVLARMRIEAGAASVKGFGLGNANFDAFEFKGGLGHSELDFGGDYRRKGTVKASVTVGRLVIRVPKSLGLRVKAPDTWSNRVSLPAELVLEGDRYVSPNFATAEGRLDMEADTRVGGIEIKWE